MANRAYLYSSDCSNPQSIDPNWEFYLDSRHYLPLSWIFLFSANSFQTVEIKCASSTWREGYFSATKELCRSNWQARFPFFENTLSSLGLSSDICGLDDFFQYPGTRVVLDYRELDFMEDYTVADFLSITESIDSRDRETFIALIGKLSDLAPNDPQLAVYGAHY